MKRTEFNIIRKHESRVAYKKRQKEENNMTEKTMKHSRYYMIETILDDAVCCKIKKDEYGEYRYSNQAIGFVFALSSAGIINGGEFKRVTDYIIIGCYENAKLDLKHILTD